ncbi:MAG: HNH endonuclease [Candidatus Eisenbacteria bacterium]|nr:HNH endonuclease [Candidatus Eisenbacteria bacterium]
MAAWTDEELERIYDSTSGRCHLCGKRLAWTNYGAAKDKRGAWHVDHSRPLARGGGDDLRNTKPACVSCNCSKQAGHNRTIRARHGRTRAPLSRRRREEEKLKQGFAGAAAGVLIGGAIAGPPGAWVGGAVMAMLAHDHDPD